MADIIKNDVRTYVRELIAKEFGTNTNAEKILSDDRKTISDKSRDGQHRPLYNQPSMKKQVQAISKKPFDPISLLEAKFKSSEYFSIPPA